VIARCVNASERPARGSKGDDVPAVDAEGETRVGSLQSGGWRDDVPTTIIVSVSVSVVGGHDDEDETDGVFRLRPFPSGRVALDARACEDMFVCYNQPTNQPTVPPSGDDASRGEWIIHV